MSAPVMQTRLAHWRKWRGLDQRTLSRLSGVPYSTLKRLEQGDYKRPPSLAYLVNLAIVLGCPRGPADLLEDAHRGWTALTGGPVNRPDPDPNWEPGEPPSLRDAIVRLPFKTERDAAADRRWDAQRRAARRRKSAPELSD